MKLLCQYIITTLILSFSLNLLANDINNAARKGCECLESPYAKIFHVQTLLQQAIMTQDSLQIMAAQGNLSDLHHSTTSCFESINEQYPNIRASKELSEQVNQNMSDLCPPPNFGINTQEYGQ